MKSQGQENKVGQKVNPYGLRLGINKTWKSKWYVDPRDYASTLHEDLRLRRTIDKSSENDCLSFQSILTSSSE